MASSTRPEGFWVLAAQPAASTAINIAQPIRTLIADPPMCRHMIDTVMPGHATGSLLRRESSITDVPS
jgi:hypothetical protein